LLAECPSQPPRRTLAAKKAQGKRLRNPVLTVAADKRDKVPPILQKLTGQSLRAIAAELDRRGIKSWGGKPWNAVSVRNAMVRLDYQTTGARHAHTRDAKGRIGPLRRRK
jgi:hypothetical protein